MSNETKRPITISAIAGLAEQLEADAAKVRGILAQATDGEISPDEAAAALREMGISIF